MDAEKTELARRRGWLPGRGPQFLAAAVVNLIAFAFGTVVGWPSVAVGPLTEAGYSDDDVSWAAALVWPAALVGAALFGPLAERCGRRAAGLAVAAPLLAGWAALLRDWGLTALLLGRGLSGVGMGGVLVVCPLYVGEVVEDSLRGQLGSYMPVFLNAGVLFVYVVGAQVSLFSLAVVCGAVPAAFLALFAWFPETPVFLLSRGRDQDAIESLLWLRDDRKADVKGEIAAMRKTIDGSTKELSGADEPAARPQDLVATPGTRRALTVVLGLLALQQLSGITAIINYAASIFESAGSSMDPSASASVVAAVQLVGSLLAVALVDRLGRRVLLIVSLGGLATTLAVLGGCFYWREAAPGWLPVICLSGYILLYALGIGPMPFVVLVEVFKPRLRSLASSVSLAFLFTLAFLVAKFFSTLVAVLGPYGCFWLFAGCCAAGVGFTLVLVPETAGKTLGQVQAILEGTVEDDSRRPSLDKRAMPV